MHTPIPCVCLFPPWHAVSIALRYIWGVFDFSAHALAHSLAGRVDLGSLFQPPTDGH